MVLTNAAATQSRTFESVIGSRRTAPPVIIPPGLCKILNNPLTTMKFHGIPYVPVRTG